MQDLELLREYVEQGSEKAFGEIVSRHVDMVYSAALRQLGDPQLAQDVTQTVFMALAAQGHKLPGKTVLPGWLYQCSRFAATKVVRTERRRRERETKAAIMGESISDTAAGSNAEWEQILPLLDEAMGRLGQVDRDALVLRFFKNKNLKEVGTALGIKEDAAQKRVARAVEKLRSFFSGRGVTISSTSLAAVLSAQVVQAAPAGLAVSITAASLLSASAITNTTLTLGLLQTMAWSKLKTAVVVGVALSAAVTPLVLQQHSLSHLRAANEQLISEIQKYRDEEQGWTQRLNSATQEAERYRIQASEIHGLRSEMARLKKENAALAKLKNSAPSQSVNDPAKAQQTTEHAPKEFRTFEEVGQYTGKLRGGMMGGKSPTQEEIDYLASVKPQLEKLERSPKEFAAFQSSYIESVAGLADKSKAESIRQIIEQTYNDAVQQGLDLPSKPAGDAESWKKNRHALDRRGTEAVQELLTPEERQRFDRMFLGIMGADTGLGMDKSNYPDGFIITADKPPTEGGN
jgi:RNA polymerase sigma factor (sigma-70 family)